MIATYNEIQFDQFVVKLISISRGLGILNSDKPSMKIVGQFIFNQFGKDFTANEVSHAFELNSAQKLSCDTKPYSTFNLEYVGAVLKAYKQYRQHTLDNHKTDERKQLEPPAVEIPWEQHCEMMHGIISNYIEQHKKLPIAGDWEACFDHLTAIGEIKMTTEEKKLFSDLIKAKLHLELAQKKNTFGDWRTDEKNINDKKFIAKLCRETKAKEYYSNKIVI